MNKKKILWIELLRIAACIGVIGIHVSSQLFKHIDVNLSAWAVSNFYHGITRYAVACFLMISGALYLDANRHWNLKKLWKHNILSIAVAYIFWQAFYAMTRGVPSAFKTGGILAALKRFLVCMSASYFHLWYLTVLIALLIITPMLWEIVNCERGKQWEEYTIILFIFFQIAIYTINYFDLPCKKHIMNMLNTVKPELVVGYVGYFILGHYLMHYEISKKLEKIIYVTGIILIAASIVLCHVASRKSGSPVQSFYENYTLAALGWSCAVFLFFKNYVSKIIWNDRQERVIYYLGSCTFGIYLIHISFRRLLHHFGIDGLMIGNTALAIPLVMAMIFILSLIAVSIIKKIPILNRWIV